MRTGIALGSNLGDRRMLLRLARDRILALPAVSGLAEALCAPLYETAPVDCPPGAGPFLNTVMEIECSLPPDEFLGALRRIEADLGRPTRHPRNSSRSIDLDLLYAGNIEIDMPELTLPHPRMAERRFVLEPLAAIRPELVLPGQVKSVADLLRGLEAPAAAVIVACDW